MLRRAPVKKPASHNPDPRGDDHMGSASRTPRLPFRCARTTGLVMMAVLAGAPAVVQPQSQKLPYPRALQGEVVDDYHGTKIADPYRWMEDLESREVAGWIAAENTVTSAYLDSLPLRAHFGRRITELWNYPKTGIPIKEAGRYFYARNTGLQRQSAVYVVATLGGTPSLLLDPNVLWPDGSTSLSRWSPSPAGNLFAYGLSEGGADWQTIRVRDLPTGKDLTDDVKWVRFSGLSWTKDGKGFFYSRYPEPPKGKVLEAALSGQALYYHRIGSPQSQDPLIYARPDNPTWFIGGGVSEDGRYLFITTSKGSDNNNRLYYADLGQPMQPNVQAPVKPVTERDDAEFSPIGNRGSVVFLRSDLEAPNRKVLAIDLAKPDPSAWKTVIPERKEALESAALIGGRLVGEYLTDVQSRLLLFDLDGRAQGAIALPAAGTVAGLSGREDSPEIFYGFTSPIYPTTVFHYDAASKSSTPFAAAKPPVDVTQYETKALFAMSKDGTKVPFFMTSRTGLEKNGANPTMIYGYGGFSISTMPAYRTDIPAWLEMGGVWVTANMRGGAEYGEAWHKGGMLEHKQNVFDDFIAVAEHLVKERYTSPAKIGIMGGSNGGLLVGAVEEQRPDLFAVALPAVGVMDMLRYDRFTGGRAWATEYGSSSDPAQFKYLVKYSPLHNVKPGVCYPATLVTTADHDDRVVPSHSFKFTAAMQAAQGCERPILIRVETQGSHGYRPTDKRIAELADLWAFAAANMGMTQPAPRD
jgi:prolyl oligopeptidase